MKLKNLPKYSASSWYPGTCGELVQGFYNGGKPFHITLPIKKYSRVKIIANANNQKGINISGPSENAEKIKLALTKTAELLKQSDIHISFEKISELEIGKGMASSTADILSAADALSIAFNHKLSSNQLAQIATSIESSDGLMYPGLAACDQASGKLIKLFDWYPQFNLVIIIPPTTIKTESVNFTSKESLCKEYDEILKLLDNACNNKSESTFARAATKSALLNQQYLYNQCFEKLHNKLDHFGALGINVAHTGTMSGLIFGSNQKELALSTALKLKDMFPDHIIEATQVEGTRRWL